MRSPQVSLLPSDGESKVGEHLSESQYRYPRPRLGVCSDNKDQADVDDTEWIDDDVGMKGVAGDLMQIEFHAVILRGSEGGSYVGKPAPFRKCLP